MLEHIDNLIIGGGMAYTFVKAMGGEVASQTFTGVVGVTADGRGR